MRKEKKDKILRIGDSLTLSRQKKHVTFSLDLKIRNYSLNKHRCKKNKKNIPVSMNRPVVAILIGDTRRNNQVS